MSQQMLYIVSVLSVTSYSNTLFKKKNTDDDDGGSQEQRVMLNFFTHQPGKEATSYCVFSSSTQKRGKKSI